MKQKSMDVQKDNGLSWPDLHNMEIQADNGETDGWAFRIID